MEVRRHNLEYRKWKKENSKLKTEDEGWRMSPGSHTSNGMVILNPFCTTIYQYLIFLFIVWIQKINQALLIQMQTALSKDKKQSKGMFSLKLFLYNLYFKISYSTVMYGYRRQWKT